MFDEVSYDKGKNYEVFQKACQFFKQKKNVDLIHYKYHLGGCSKQVGWKSQVKPPRCRICGEKLYKLDNLSRYSPTKTLKVSYKKHMVFVDKTGREHQTCYRTNLCYRRVGFEHNIHEGTPFKVDSIELPSLEEYLRGDVGLSGIDAYKIDSAEYSFQNYVHPFLEKWMTNPINKSNVLEFMRDLQLVESKFLVLYCNPVKPLKQRLFEIIGVEI